MNIDTNSIFISQQSFNRNIDGKITYTNIMETIPENSSEFPLENWRELNKTEWRWRFLKFPDKKIKVEISYLKPNSKNRVYFNKYGQWVKKDISKEYDKYVIKSYYYYATN